MVFSSDRKISSDPFKLMVPSDRIISLDSIISSDRMIPSDHIKLEVPFCLELITIASSFSLQSGSWATPSAKGARITNLKAMPLTSLHGLYVQFVPHRKHTPSP
jgi:hypothetical protein